MNHSSLDTTAGLGRLRVARRSIAALAVLLMAAPSQAQTVVTPLPSNVVSLTASATTEVQKDWLTVVFSTTRDGPDASVVQSQLRQALEAALAEARRLARPGQVEVQTGGFSLFPRYAPRGGINGWQGSAELLVEGRDTAAISQLTGRLTSMSVARVQFSLSRQAREQVEADVTAQAIAGFRTRADAAARAFGFGGYTVREVNIGSDMPPPGIVMQRSRATMAAPAAADESLPVEAGKAAVTVTVNGSVQLR